jgi:hypothetical protein
MQTTTAALTINGPLKTAEHVPLFRARGRVHSVRAFALAHLNRLSAHERSFIRPRVDALARHPPHNLRAPLTRSERLHDGTPGLIGVRQGARSAFIPGRGFKLKGCRPEPTTFPAWEIDDSCRVNITHIPFGALRLESVMREILGYCFLLAQGMTPTSVPLAVMEYADVGSDGRFALVSRVLHDTRVESRLSCRGLTVHSLLRLYRAGRGTPALGGEVDLAGMDRARYVEAKSDLLLSLNRGGGFRGILNSNIGNDVVAGATLAGLCDFDTFVAWPVPAAGDSRAIRRFVVQATLELLKTSLPFVDFLELPESREDAQRALARYYTSNSSVYHAYVGKLLGWASTIGWDRALVEEQIAAALSTAAAWELLKELVPNTLTFGEFTLQSWYVAHG